VRNSYTSTDNAVVVCVGADPRSQVVLAGQDQFHPPVEFCREINLNDHAPAGIDVSVSVVLFVNVTSKTLRLLAFCKTAVPEAEIVTSGYDPSTLLSPDGSKF
jgi:hypothetical protein